MKKLLILIASLQVSIAVAGQQLSRELDQLIQHYAPNAEVGLIVQDAETGKVLYAKNDYLPSIPASNLKLLTAAATLLDLGPDYEFKTQVGITNHDQQNRRVEDLVFHFSGDPSLASDDIKELITEIKRKNIHRVTGRVLIDAHHFEKPFYAPGLSHDDIPWYYAAPSTGAIVDENFVRMTIQPSQKLNGPVQATVKSVVPMKVNNQMISVSREQAKHDCYAFIEMQKNNDLLLQGCWPIAKKKSFEKIAIVNPLYYINRLIAQELQQQGIEFNEIQVGRPETNTAVIAEHKSEPLINLIGTMLKDSNNLYADSLLKTLGYVHFKHGNFKMGVKAMKNILHQATDIDFSRAVIIDGAGDSRYNLITPRLLLRLLYVIYHNPHYKLFLKALPDAGRDGTLADRMRSFDLQGRVFAKTGTMSGVSALSGYLLTEKNRTLVFSIMINHIISTPDDSREIYRARQLQAEIASALTRYRG